MKNLALLCVLIVVINFNALASGQPLDEEDASQIKLFNAYQDYGGISPGTAFQLTWLHVWQESRKRFGNGAQYHLADYLNKDSTNRIPYIESWINAPGGTTELRFAAGLFFDTFVSKTGLRIEEFMHHQSLVSSYVESNSFGRWMSDVQDTVHGKKNFSQSDLNPGIGGCKTQ